VVETIMPYYATFFFKPRVLFYLCNTKVLGFKASSHDWHCPLGQKSIENAIKNYNRIMGTNHA
jgi:hypothetical protein